MTRHWQLSFVLIFLLGTLSFFSNVVNWQDLTAQVFQEQLSSEELKEKYENNGVKILIVPGHDNQSVAGAQYKGVKEADLNLQLALELYNLLSDDLHFETYIARDQDGYLVELDDYFRNNRGKIAAFRKRAKNLTENLIKRGVVVKKVHIEHNTASNDDSIKLHGINGWANENDADIVIHIHFNDYPGRKRSKPGKFYGFSIYIPESQLPNHRASKGLADSIVEELKKSFSVSNFFKEKKGIIEDQELIAVGANNTLKGAGVLIEYGYIYEPQIISAEKRRETFKKMAVLTYRGIKKYFVD